jgi:hypothetical protein
MSNGPTAKPSAGKRRCKAKTRRGQPCAAIVVGADGYCSAHSGKVDMRELGRRGGSKSPGQGGKGKPPAAEQRSLLAQARATIGDERVIEALEELLAGTNQGAKVQAIRLLADRAGSERTDFETQRQAWMQELEGKKDALLQRLNMRARAVRDDQCAACGAWLAQLEQLEKEFLERSDKWVPNDVDPETCRIVMQGLIDIGLIRPRAPTVVGGGGADRASCGGGDGQSGA